MGDPIFHSSLLIYLFSSVEITGALFHVLRGVAEARPTFGAALFTLLLALLYLRTLLSGKDGEHLCAGLFLSLTQFGAQLLETSFLLGAHLDARLARFAQTEKLFA